MSPDWWSGDGDSLTPRQTITELEWDSILRQNDFLGTDLIMIDYDNDATEYDSIIVSTASPYTGGVSADKLTKVLIVVSEGYEHH